MKYFCCALLLVIATAVQSELTQEQKAKLQQHAEQCQKVSPVDVQVLNNARKGNFDDKNNALKGYLLCIAEKSGFIAPDGKIQTSVLETKLSSVVSKENAKKLVEKCTAQKNLDKRESALGIYKCIYAETKFSLI